MLYNEKRENVYQNFENIIRLQKSTVLDVVNFVIKIWIYIHVEVKFVGLEEQGIFKGEELTVS